jgi:uncharacterized repeat protein (TIGR01451 family)
MLNAVNHKLALWAAFAAALLCGNPTAATAQRTISNVASMQWDVGITHVVRSSNQIDLLVDASSPATPTLTTYQFATPPGAVQLAVPTTLCRGPGGDAPVILEGAFAGLSTSPATLEPTSSIRAGEPLVLSISSVADNKDPAKVDTIVIRVTTVNDSETLTLQESGANTGVFIGLIRTAAIPPTPVPGDCVLSVHPGDTINLSGIRASDNSPIASAPVDVLIDPFGTTFDSGDGQPVQKTRVTLIDITTGQPAIVFGDDGVSRFPATLETGDGTATVTDTGGQTYTFPVGEYRFPFVRAGQYRLLVEPPGPYTAPSSSTPADLAGLRRPDGQPFALSQGSYGVPFTLSDPAPVRIDIPLDRPGGALTIRKTASQPVAQPGDAIQYRVTVQNGDNGRATGAITVTDILPPEMRLKDNTVRYNGIIIPYLVTSDGKTLTILLPPLAAAKSGVVTYVLEVRPDAQPGHAMNRASAADNRGTQSAIVDAAVRITRDGIGDRMTIIGRITDGGCTVDPDAANGVPGVRVIMEDGSYAVTDIEGRYHFEGVLPGLHVVQMDPSSLPANQIPTDCTRNTRSAGSAISRFVEGHGGALLRVDFRSQAGVNVAKPAGSEARRATPVTDQEAAATNRNWFADGEGGIAWLFPEAEHNPRTKAVRVAIRHLASQTVSLFANGKPVDHLAFDGARKNGDGTLAVSIWTGVELAGRDTLLSADVKDADGKLVQHMTRNVHFATSALHATFLKDKSRLIADGVTRPLIALRMTDRDGKPVHHGLVGDFDVPAPYFPAVEADAQAARSLAGLERAKPVWHVEGEDGIAYIELEPTTVSGSLSITLPLRDGEVKHSQRIDTWIEPGKRPWTVVGFAAGTVGFNTLSGRAEKLGADGTHWYTDARIALYAKGRIKGKWLMTLAYDSDKNKDEARFGGTIDPTAYYTIYADRTERRYDAQSIRKLYLKLERPQFYALFGDYETGIGEPQLARYVRAFNGVKAEFRNDHVSVKAFAADTPFRHRREEIQGNGLSGPYQLAARDILPNSEEIRIEVRDRLRSDRIVDTRKLVRHIDYDIDYIAGTIRFREPILSRSSLLDPQFVIADYEVDGVAQRVTNAGGRATWTNTAKTLTVGATAIHNEDDQAKTNLGGLDVRYTPNAATELRAEVGVSDASVRAGVSGVKSGTSTAWLVEAEHHGPKYDVLAYARQQDKGYGVGQTNGGEDGTRKFGVDGRYRITPDLSLVGSAYQEDYLGSIARRQAGKALVEYKTKGVDLRAGAIIANDRLQDGQTTQSTIAQLGATKRLFNNKLELDAQTEFKLSGSASSIDFPARHRFGARYSFTNDISIIGGYEIAKGDKIDARTARIGFDLKPWSGGRLVSSLNNQSTNDYGPRTYAAYGLAQSLPIGKQWTVDATLDGNKTLGGGIARNQVLNPAQPVASGGFVGQDGTLAEDFTAVTAGATFRNDRWSWTGRAEYRAGERTDRYGLTTAALRQIGEGRAFGGAFSFFRASERGGARTETASLALSWANRPDNSRFAFLEKLELKSDTVKNAVIGQSGPIGGAPLTINGDAASKRIINSFSLNWSPTEKRDGEYLTRSEISFFWGSRYVFDRFGADDLKGWSNVFGTDIKFDLGKTVDVGVSATIRQNPGGRSLSFSGGPAIGIAPLKNTYISVGYNVVGYRDRDFEDSRYTRSGPFVTLRLKFDQTSLQSLGLGRK